MKREKEILKMTLNQSKQRQSKPTRNGKGFVLISCVMAALALVAVIILFFDCDPDDVWTGPRVREKKQNPSVTRRSDAEQPTKAKAPKVRGAKAMDERKKEPRQKVKVVFSDSYTPEERKVAEAVQAALDEDDLDQTCAAAALAMKSANPDLRCEAVQALGWFGEKALVDLTKALADKNPAVAEAARDQVEQALTGMEDSHQAFALASSYVEALRGDREATKMLLSIMECKGCEIVEPEDGDSIESVQTARARRQDIVTALSRLIKGNDASSEEARLAYNTITGEEWTDLESAEKWAVSVPDPEVEENAEPSADE